MPRVRHEDTPEYAVDVVEGAKPISSQLGAAAGLLTMLLVAMSAVEAPMPRHLLHAEATIGTEVSSSDGLGLLCSIGGKFKNWISVEAS